MKKTAQLGFYFDQTRCTGCFACVVACKDWNDVPAGPASWRQVKSIEKGDWPDLFAAYFTSSCYHCAEPVCVTVCPAQAISKREEDGIVVVDRQKCREAASCGIITNYKNIPFGEMKSPCTLSCPAGVNVSGYVALLAKGKFQEALELIRQDLPLPSVCGRVCKHPCETTCKRQELDEPVAIAGLKRFLTDYVKYAQPEPLPVTQNHKVAIVGSGPAGLAAAWALKRYGYSVTVFEALPVAGGMLAVGIPEYRLPGKALQQDLDYLTSLGIEIKTNSPVRDLDGLKRQGFEAVFLAVGAHQGSKLPIPGADLKGTFAGTSFLREVNLVNKPELGKRVVVVGGGDVAFDCARSAWRMGASEVSIVCLENSDSLPADPSEISEGIEEGIIIHDACSVRRILGNGKVTGVEFQSICNLDFSKGKPDFDIVPDSVKTIGADSVIFAIGQSPDLSPFPGLQKSSRFISIDPLTFATSQPGVFAAGDATGVAGSVIDAIAAGKKAASSIDAYLQGLVFKSMPPMAVNPLEIQVAIPQTREKQPRKAMPALAVAKRRNSAEVSTGYKKAAAITEAERCLNCAGHLCREVCPYHAPQFRAEPEPKMELCNLCLDRWAEGKKPICVGACPVRALDAGRVAELQVIYGSAREAEGFAYASSKPSVIFRPKKYKPKLSSR